MFLPVEGVTLYWVRNGGCLTAQPGKKAPPDTERISECIRAWAPGPGMQNHLTGEWHGKGDPILWAIPVEWLLQEKPC